MSRIIPRAEWGATRRAGFGDRPVGRLDKWLHHSVTLAPDLVFPWDDDYAAVRLLEKIGQDRFAGGISYTFAVTPAGLIFEGTGVSRIGAHTAGRNTGSVGIVLVGNYDRDNPPQAMLDAVAWLLRHGAAQGWWQTAALTGGHRDTKSTSCPGTRGYAQIRTINELAAGSAVVAPAVPPTAATPSKHPVLVYGSRGPEVGVLQRFLGIDDDDSFGPATLRATKAYQTSVGLKDDGSVGPLTWAKIDANEGRPAAPAPAPAPATPAAPPFPLGQHQWFGWKDGGKDSISGYFSHSEYLERFQQRLKDRGWNIDPDGKYGPQTNRITKAFQVDKGLTPNGAIGPDTWAAAWTTPIT